MPFYDYRLTRAGLIVYQSIMCKEIAAWDIDQIMELLDVCSEFARVEILSQFGGLS